MRVPVVPTALAVCPEPYASPPRSDSNGSSTATPAWEPPDAEDQWDEQPWDFEAPEEEENRKTEEKSTAGDEPQPSAADVFEAALITFDEMENRPPPVYLVDKMLVRNSLAVLFGPPGVGKSFVATDIGAHVAIGAWWQGRRVEAGTVLAVAAEGAGGLPQRVAAWKKHNRIYEVPGHVTYPGAVNFLDPDQVYAVVEVCKRRQFALVIIDTVARSMPGADENSAKDMGLLIMAADHIRAASGACVLLVHHTGKDLSAGMRGSSALEGAADTAMEVSGGEGRLKVACRKQKDAGPFQAMQLSLEVVDVVCAGVATTSCAVTGRPLDTWVPPARIDQAKEVLVQCMSSTGMTGAAVREALMERMAVGKSTAYEVTNALVKAGVLLNSGTARTPFYVIEGEERES